jgi:natural product biosynthesis luciferase-like monooxygenase protein
MRYGIHTVEDYRDESHHSVPHFYENLIDRAILAEELGYEGFWLTEHHFHWYGGVHANPLVALSAIAARTTKLRLGTAVTLLPYSHPLRIAEDYALLDNLSHGRVDLGVGRGYYKIEYDGWGIAMSESRERFSEHLDVIVRAWTESNLTFRGRFTDVEDLELIPRPVQRPHPPIWLAASITPESFERNGALGRPLMVVPLIAPVEQMQPLVALYRDAYRAAGHGGEPEILGIFMTHIGNDDTQAYREQMQGAIENFRAVAEIPERKMRGERDPKQYEHFKDFLENMKWFTFENVYRNDSVLCGSPEHVADVIDRWRTEVGLTYISIHPSWGGFDEDTVRTTMRSMAEQVWPLVAEREVAGRAR